MDVSISHDPFRPEEVRVDGSFRADRWQRAGATPDQLAVLEERHAALTGGQQQGEGLRIDGVSDTDLADELDGLKATAAEKRHTADPPEEEPVPAAQPSEGPVADIGESEPPKKAAAKKAAARHRRPAQGK